MATSKKIEEKTVEEGMKVGYEMQPLFAASTEEYTLFAVEKVYVNVQFQVKGDNFTAGFNFVPTFGHEVRIAMPIGDAKFDPPQGAITYKQFEDQFERLADTVLGYRSRILSDGNKTAGF